MLTLQLHICRTIPLFFQVLDLDTWLFGSKLLTPHTPSLMGKNSYTEGKWSIVPINCQKTIQSVRLNLFIVSKYFIRYKILKRENTDCIGRGKK